MGASLSSNLATMLSNVSTDIATTTKVSQSATNDCNNSQTVSGCDIEAIGDVNITSGCNLLNSVQQMGSVSNSTQLANDVAMQLAQQATSETGFLGIGLSSAVNSSFTSSSISNTVSTTSKTEMNKANQAISNQTVGDCKIKTTGKVTISNMSNLSLSGDQTGSTENLSDVSNTVSETVTQSASATVSGFSFGFVVIIVAVIIAMIIGKVVMNQKKGSGVSGGSLRGGAVTTSMIWNTVGSLVIAGSFVGIGTMNMNNRTPCNNNAQCDSSLWYNPSWGCSCTDHLTCGLNEQNHTPLSTGVPLLMVTPMTNSADNDVAYLRKMTVRSVCGFDASVPQANNSGFNLKNYIKMYQIANSSNSSSVSSQVRKIFDGLYDFFQRHCTAEGSDDDNNPDFTIMYDPAFVESNSDPNEYIQPCTNDIVMTLLPLTPYYMPPSDVVEKADATDANPQTADTTTATGDGSSCSSKTSLLSRRPGPIRLNGESADAYNGFGTVNVAQHLCYKEEKDSVQTDLDTVNFMRQDSSGDCPDGWKHMWSTNSMIQSTVYRTKQVDVFNDAAEGQKGTPITSNNNCDGYYYMYSNRGSESDFDEDGDWEKVTDPVQVKITDVHDFNCDNSVGSIEIRSSKNGTWGSYPDNTNGSTDAAIGRDFWPGNLLGVHDAMADVVQSGWVSSSNLSNNKFSDYNLMYQSGNSYSRLPLAHVQQQTLVQLDHCFNNAGTENYQVDTNMMPNDTDYYDGNNAAAYRAAVQTADGGMKVGTFCQTFGTTSGEGSSDITESNAPTRFVVHNNGQNRTLDTLSYAAMQPSSKEKVGFNAGDKLCRIGSGFSQYAGQYPYMTTMTNQKYDMTPDSVAASILSNTLNSDAHIYTANLSQAMNSGPTLPLGDCKINYQDGANVKECSTSDLYNCWNPELCKTMGGTWKVDRPGFDPALCADGYDVNLSKDGQDCYPGRCLTKDQVCSETNCQGCSKDECPTSNQMCKVAGGACMTGCYPEAGLCTNCTEESACTAPCFYDADRNTCTYGAQRCDQSQDDGNKACCPEESDAIYYLVRIPDAFTSSGVNNESFPNAMNCSPGVFTPDPTLKQGFDMSFAALADDAVNPNTNNRVCGDNSDFSSAPFTVNCAAEGSNCYGDGLSLFQVMSIPARPECFFDTSQDGPNYNTDNSQEKPELFCAIENRDEQQNWASENSGNDKGLAMWYMVNRIFSWTMMLQGTAKRQSYLTSILGLSTLLNDQGMDTDTNSPYLPLDSVDHIQRQLESNSWARVQPLLFIAGDDYHFATLEDIANGRCQWWKDSYISQINQFVYDTEGTSQFTTSISGFAEGGIGDGFQATTDISSVLEQMENYKGTLIGSTGSCNTLWSNDVLTYGSFGIAGVVVVGLLFMWVLAIKKK